MQHNGNAFCMAWHPVKKTLAIGFASMNLDENILKKITCIRLFLFLDGELMIWNGSNRRLESVIVHKTCITSLTFNTDGTRLLSADQVFLEKIFSFCI